MYVCIVVVCCDISFVAYIILQETQKFRTELFKKLSKEKETFGDDLDKVVEVCSEVVDLISCFFSSLFFVILFT